VFFNCLFIIERCLKLAFNERSTLRNLLTYFKEENGGFITFLHSSDKDNLIPIVAWRHCCLYPFFVIFLYYYYYDDDDDNYYRYCNYENVLLYRDLSSVFVCFSSLCLSLAFFIIIFVC